MEKEKEEENSGKTGDEYIKITISRAAEEAAAGLVEKVNTGFEAGKVTRQDLISWIVLRFSGACTDQEVRAIRADHFDEIALLEQSFRRYKQAGRIPPELKKLLLAQAGIEETSRKTARKAVDTGVAQ